MKVLLTLIKGILWLLLLLVLLVLLTVLSWWMQWPLMTGAVILLVLFGLLIAFLGARALYRWHDKTRFVRKVLDEQSAMEAAAPMTLGRMADAWRQGMEVLRTSPHRFHERMELSQPWFVTLDATGASSGLFAPLGDALPEKTDTPLVWHFLSSSVLLHCPDALLSQSDWQELLEKLAQQRRHIPLRGIILLLSTADISHRSDEELAALGRQLRTRTQQLMLTLNRRYPIYVLVEGIDALPGMDKILNIVPANDFDAVLGHMQHDQASARDAAEEAAARMEDIVRAASVDGRQPEGDMLEALRSLRALGGRLHLAMEQISREVVHQTRPLLAGVCFCQGGNTTGQRPAFLTGLLSYVLPASTPAAPLTRGLPFVANTRVCVMGAWFLLLLGVCGLMGVNVLYQHQALSETVPQTASVIHDEEINKLYQQMLYIQMLSKARKAWYLPTFGQDAILHALKASQTDFTEKVYEKILSPLLAKYRSLLTGTAGLTRDQERACSRELTWLTAVASDRLKNAGESTETKAFPVATPNSTLWNPVTGLLIVNAVKSMADGGQLEMFTEEMRTLLAASLRRQGDNALEDIMSEIDDRYPAAKVCLSNFWPHVAPANPNNVCVPSSYTKTGYKVFSDIMEDLESMDDGSGGIAQSTNAFRTEYFRRYADRWLNFAKAFSKIRVSMQEGDVFVSYADIRKIEDMPHYRVMQQLTDELVPLQHAKESPPWLSSCMLMDLVVDIAIFEHQGAATSRARTLLSLVTSAPELVQRLRAETKDAKQARQMLGVAESIHAYFDDVLSLLPVLTSLEQSYTFASTWFGGARMAGQQDAKPIQNNQHGEQKDTTKSAYANAQKQLEIILAPFKGSGQNPMLDLMPGFLDFIAQGVTVQAAKVVQESWENDVLGSATALYRQDDVAGLFGDKGVVQTFVDARLKPFLSRRDKALAPARWGDIEFPFTTDALKVLSQAEMIAAQPPEDTYYVQLRSQPTLVNVDARERADSTTLSLQCQDKTYSLINRNYPRNEKFQYTVKQCGHTTLEIDFPSFTLTRHYDTFTDFLKDFQYGERDFSQDDFEDAADKMEAAGVNSVTVRILPDNVVTLLQKEGNEPPALPDRITYVW